MTTYCLGLWNLGQFGKRPFNEYIVQLRRSLEILTEEKVPIWVFYDDSRVVDLINKFKHKINKVYLPFNQLPTISQSSYYATNFKQKGRLENKKKNKKIGQYIKKFEKTRPNYDPKKDPPTDNDEQQPPYYFNQEEYRRHWVIWSSKLLILGKCLHQFKGKYVCWLDLDYLLNDTTNKFNLLKQQYLDNYIYYTYTTTEYYTNPIEYSSQCLIGLKDKWALFVNQLNIEIQLNTRSNYIETDDTLLAKLNKRTSLLSPLEYLDLEIHVYGMKRSGHHLVVDILQKKYPNSYHLNNYSWAKKGRNPFDVGNSRIVIISLEDEPQFRNFTLFPASHVINILVMRDPYNNYASRLQFLDNLKKQHLEEYENIEEEELEQQKELIESWEYHTELNHYKEIFMIYLKEFMSDPDQDKQNDNLEGQDNDKKPILNNLRIINYNKLINKKTREGELKKINCNFEYKCNQIITPDGSSFEGFRVLKPRKYNERYLKFLDHPDMIKLISDPSLRKITNQVFNLDVVIPKKNK